MNEMKVFLASIKDSLLLIAIMSLCTFILLCLFIGYRIIEHVDESKTKAVVAYQDIKAGTVIDKDMLRTKKIDDSKLPDLYVCPHSARILYGHKSTTDFKKGEPLVFSKFDIYIPYKLDIKNPNETDVSNPSSPDR